MATATSATRVRSHFGVELTAEATNYR